MRHAAVRCRCRRGIDPELHQVAHVVAAAVSGGYELDAGLVVADVLAVVVSASRDAVLVEERVGTKRAHVRLERLISAAVAVAVDHVDSVRRDSRCRGDGPGRERRGQWYEWYGDH